MTEEPPSSPGFGADLYRGLPKPLSDSGGATRRADALPARREWQQVLAGTPWHRRNRLGA